MNKVTGIILFLLCSVLAYGQSVRASIDSSEVYLGQPFEYRIIIEGSTNSNAPDLGKVDGFNIQYKGASTSMISSFGTGSNSSSKTVTYSWIFSSLRSGTLLIPSFEIDVEGKIFKTASGSITVKEPEPIEGFHLFIETDKNSYWFGEPITMTIKWLFSSQVSNPSFSIPFINSGLFTVKNQDPPSGSDVFKLNIKGLDVLAMQSAEIYKGKQYTSLSFGLKLYPKAPGMMFIDPISLAFEKATGSSGFRTSYKSVVIPSNNIKLEIKDLPPEAIQNGKRIILSEGELKIDVDANPKKVHIGDPLTFILKVEGAILPEEVEIPPLNSFNQMDEHFSIPEKRSTGKVEENIVLFSQTIRVKDEKISFIPPLEFNYFNTKSGLVKTFITEQIPIEVIPTEIITSADLESTGYSVIKNTEKNELISNEKGILTSFDLDKIVTKGNSDPNSVFSAFGYWFLLFLPISIYIGLVIFKYRKKIIIHILNISGNNDDFKRNYKFLKSKDNIQEKDVKSLIYEYLNSFCNTHGKFLTKEEYSEMLISNKLEKDLCNRIISIISSFEYKYSKNKIIPEWNKILDEFYLITMEINGKC